MTLLLIGVAGGLGAITRYGVGVWMGPRSFPMATLTVNVVGSFAFALLAAVAVRRGVATEPLTTAAIVGFIGAFTTFSTFSVEMLRLMRDGRLTIAVLYALASVLLGLLAAVGGYALGQGPTS